MSRGSVVLLGCSVLLAVCSAAACASAQSSQFFAKDVLPTAPGAGLCQERHRSSKKVP